MMVLVGGAALMQPQAFTKVMKIAAQGIGMKPDEYPSEKNKYSDDKHVKNDCVSSKTLKQTAGESNKTNSQEASQGHKIKIEHTEGGRPRDLDRTANDSNKTSGCSNQ